MLGGQAGERADLAEQRLKQDKRVETREIFRVQALEQREREGSVKAQRLSEERLEVERARLSLEADATKDRLAKDRSKAAQEVVRLEILQERKFKADRLVSRRRDDELIQQEANRRVADEERRRAAVRSSGARGHDPCFLEVLKMLDSLGV